MTAELHSYAELSLRVRQQSAGRHVPLNGTIEVTNRCPLVCSHCYNNLPMNDLAARSNEMSLEEHCALLDELADLGCLWLLYSGGEIFARRDFLDIYDHAKSRGFLITLFTNGILIDERIADHLAALPPFSIEITLYGATRETYEALTRIPGSYDRCLRGIDLLMERNLPLKLKTVAVSINHHEIFAMKEMAEARGLGFKFDAMISPRIDCSSAPLSLRLKAEEIVGLDLRDSTRVAEWKRLGEKFGAEIPVAGETKHLYDCGAGVNSWAIDPYGYLTMCVLSHADKFNVRGSSFAQGWAVLGQVRAKPISRPTKCTTCSLKSLCGMCPATGELENNDPEAPVEWLCHVAHVRAAAFDVPVRPHGECVNCENPEVVRAAALRSRELLGQDLKAVPIPLTTGGGCSTGACTSCQT